MSSPLDHVQTLLFVPGDRPDRFAKAAAAGADLVVLDLEDAVVSQQKPAARANVVEWLRTNPGAAVRINAPGTEWYADDLAAFADGPNPVMLPKAEQATMSASLGKAPIIALIETAQGVLDAAAIARSVHRLAFGSFDLAAQLGVDPSDTEAMLGARTALVLASAAAGLAGPIDAVTADVRDSDLLRDEVRYARRLGFTGKLCIHPNQVPVAAAALAPTAAEIDWARSIVEASVEGGAVAVDGRMVDKPVIERAQRILRSSDPAKGAHK